MKLYYEHTEPIFDSITGELLEKCDMTKGYIKREYENEPFKFFYYSEEESNQIKNELLAQERNMITKAFSVYISMVISGILQVDSERQKEITEWYKNVFKNDTDLSIVQDENIPEEVLQYYEIIN